MPGSVDSRVRRSARRHRERIQRGRLTHAAPELEQPRLDEIAAVLALDASEEGGIHVQRAGRLHDHGLAPTPPRAPRRACARGRPGRGRDAGTVRARGLLRCPRPPSGRPLPARWRRKGTIMMARGLAADSASLQARVSAAITASTSVHRPPRPGVTHHVPSCVSALASRRRRQLRGATPLPAGRNPPGPRRRTATSESAGTRRARPATARSRRRSSTGAGPLRKRVLRSLQRPRRPFSSASSRSRVSSTPRSRSS